MHILTNSGWVANFDPETGIGTCSASQQEAYLFSQEEATLIARTYAYAVAIP